MRKQLISSPFPGNKVFVKCQGGG